MVTAAGGIPVSGPAPGLDERARCAGRPAGVDVVQVVGEVTGIVLNLTTTDVAMYVPGVSLSKSKPVLPRFSTGGFLRNPGATGS